MYMRTAGASVRFTFLASWLSFCEITLIVLADSPSIWSDSRVFIIFCSCSIPVVRARRLETMSETVFRWVSWVLHGCIGLGHWPAEPGILGSNPNGPANSCSCTEAVSGSSPLLYMTSALVFILGCL